jgi:hypothetical protein
VTLDAFTEGAMKITVFCNIMSCGLIGTNISKELVASIFRVENLKPLKM